MKQVSETAHRSNRSLQYMERLCCIFHVRAFRILLDEGVHKDFRGGEILSQAVVQLPGESPSLIVLHAHPGRIRREISVGIPHPRNFDSPEINELVRTVRKEIEDEVNRVNALMATDFWKPQARADLGAGDFSLGDGI